MPEEPNQSEQFKAKIEQSVDKALPTPEQVKKLGAKVKEAAVQNNELKKQIKDIIKKAFHTRRTEDLAIDPGEKEDIFKDVKKALIDKLGGKEQADKVMKDFGISTADALMSKIGLRSVEEQKLYEKFDNFMANKPANVFAMANLIKDKPWAKAMMLAATEYAPQAAFQNYKEFADMSDNFAKDILLQAVQKDPEAAFKNIQNYKDLDKPEDILRDAISKMEKPENVLKYIPNFDKLPFAKDVLLMVVEKMDKPEVILKYGNQLTNVDGASDVLLKALEKAQNKDIGIDEVDNYKKLKDASLVFLTALAQTSDKTVAFVRIAEYADMPNADIILKTALDMGVNHDEVYSNFNNFSKMPYARHVMIKAAEMDPVKALQNIKTLINLPDKGAQNVLTAAFEINPQLAFENENIKNYSNLPGININEIMRDVAGKNPRIAMDNIKNFKDQKWAKDVLIAVAETNQYVFLNTQNYTIDDMKSDLKQAFKELMMVFAKNVEVQIIMNLKWEKYLPNTTVSMSKLLSPPEEYAEIIKELKGKKEEFIKFASELLYEKKGIDPSQYKENKNKEEEDLIVNLSKDRGLNNVLKIKTDWIEPKPNPDVKTPLATRMDMSQARAIISRNLYADGLKVNEENIKKTWQKVIEQRENNAKINVFQGRNIIYAANNELDKDGTDRFGLKGSQDAINGQIPNKFDFLKAKISGDKEKCLNELKQVKDRLLASIKNTPPPLTFMFRGHGDDNGITLAEQGDKRYLDLVSSDPESIKRFIEYQRITPGEFAQALIERSSSFKDNDTEKEKPPILIFGECYSINLIRKISEQVSKSNSNFYAAGSSEFGTASYTKKTEKFSSSLEEDVLDLKNKNKNDPTTLGTMMQNETKSITNPSIYYHMSKEGKGGGMHEFAALGKQTGKTEGFGMGVGGRHEDEDKGPAMG